VQNCLKLLLILVLLLVLPYDGLTQLTLGFNSNGNTAGCAPYTLTFPITNVATNPASTNYTVDFGDGSPILNFTQATLPPSVTHTYLDNSCGSSFQATNNVFGATITATNPTLSPFTAAVSPIVISSPPSALVTPPNSIVCAGSSLEFSNVSDQGVFIDPSAGYTCIDNAAIHYWTISPAAGWTASAASMGNNNGFPDPVDFDIWTQGSDLLNVTFNSAGSYRVKLWIANTCGLDTISVPVCVVPPPNPQFSLSPNYACIPPNVTTTANNTTVVSSNACGTPTYTYSWAVSPASGWNFTGSSSSNSVSPSFSFSAQGTYTITLSANMTGSSGCNASISHPMTINLAPTVNAGLDQSVCVGSPPIQLIGSPAGGIWSGTGVASSGVFTPGTVGSFPLTYTFTPAGSTGCPPQTDQVIINVITPTPANAGIDQSICVGSSSIQLSGTPTGGNWSGAGVTTSGVFNPNTVGAFNLTYSFGTGPCAVSDQLTITVLSLPNVSVNSSTICNGASATLTASGSGGLGPYTYVWSPAGSLSTSTGAIVNATPSSSTVYTVFISDNNSCTNSATSTVTVNQLPSVNAGPNQTICNVPQVTQLNGTPAGGTWSGAGVTSAGAFTPSGLGPVSLTYTFTDGNGCSASDQLTVNVVNPSPANAGPDLNVCQGVPAIQLNGTPNGGSWSGTGVSTGGLFNPSTVGTFNLTYTYGSGTCLATDALTIQVNGSPSVTVNDPEICNGGTVDLIAVGSGGLAPYTYSWSPSTSIIPTTGSTVAANPSATTNYTVTITDGNSCEATDVATVTVNNVPVVDAGPNQTICLNPNPIQLNGSPSGGAWTGDNVSPTGLYTTVSIGIDTVIYTISQVGCAGVDTVLFTIVVPEPLEITSDTIVCYNSSPFQLFASEIGGVWSDTNGIVTSSGIFNPDTIGIFRVIYSVGLGYCAQTDSLLVTVVDLPIVDAGPDFSTCLNGMPAPISGEIPNSGGTWVWSGIGITDATLGIFDPSIAGIGPQVLTYTFTSLATGCTASDNLTAIVDLLPQIQIDPLALNVCLTPYGSPITATPVGGQWTGNDLSFENNFDSQLDTAVFTPSSTGLFWVYYTYSDANACQSIDSLQITVIQPLPVSAGLDTAFCFSEDDYSLIGSPVGGQWISPDWLSSSGIFSGDSLGTHEAVYSIGIGSCEVKDTIQFVVNPLPIVTISNDADFCSDDDCVTFPLANPTGGVWAGNGITDAVLGEFCPNQALVGDNEIIYTYQNPANSCINRDTLIAEVLPMPIPSFVVNPLICLNTPFQVINTSLGPPMTFDWVIRNLSDNSIIFQSTDPSPIFEIAIEGDFSVELICSSNAGCERRDTAFVSTLAPPVASFQIEDIIECGPFQSTLTNNSSGLMISYSWDFGPLFPGSSETIPLMPLFEAPIIADSLYFVELQVTNMCGSSFALDSIVIRPIPVAEIGTDYSQGCSPFTPIFQNVSYGSPDWFSWDFGNGASSTDSLPGSQTYTSIDTLSNIIIELNIGNTCGTSSFSVPIVIYPTQLNPVNQTPINGCAPFEANFSFPLGDLSFYLWDFGDNTGMTGDSVSHIYDTPGTYNVGVVVSNFCLTDTVNNTVNVYPGPQLSFSIDQESVCQSNEINIENNSSNAAGFSINYGEGFQSLTNNLTHSYDTTGTQTIFLAGVNPQNGCLDTVFQTVDVIPYPEIDISVNPDTGCMPVTVQFFNNSTLANSFEWHFADGTGSILPEPIIVLPESGDIVAQLIAHNYQGNGADCPDTAEVSIHVLPSPTSEFTLVSDTVCGPPVSAFVVNNSFGATAFTWLWESNSVSAFEPELEFQSIGLNQIQLISENEFACRDTADKGFFVLGQPQIEIDLEPALGCVPHKVLFTNLTQFGDSVSWAFGDGQFSELNQVEHTYEEPGLYSVEIYVSSGDLCFDDSVLVEIIQVNPKAQAGLFISPTTITESTPIIGLVNTSSFADVYELFVNEDLIANEVPSNYTFFNPDTGVVDITLIANNQYNCPDTLFDDIYIISSPNIFLPSSFSPNEDGLNDGFRPSLDRAPTVYYFSIYDRWGHLVFETRNFNEVWNGTYYNRGGDPLKQDVYVYKLRAIFEKDQIYNLYGNITLIH
jgi:large repetitive protein